MRRELTAAFSGLAAGTLVAFAVMLAIVLGLDAIGISVNQLGATLLGLACGAVFAVGGMFLAVRRWG